jgi:hypothetical protein
LYRDLFNHLIFSCLGYYLPYQYLPVLLGALISFFLGYSFQFATLSEESNATTFYTAFLVCYSTNPMFPSGADGLPVVSLVISDSTIVEGMMRLSKVKSVGSKGQNTAKSKYFHG